MPSACFCEAIRSDGIKQPANTWSSLAFVVVAAMVSADEKYLFQRAYNARRGKAMYEEKISRQRKKE